jgi:phosphinothricin acetyltransferase
MNKAAEVRLALHDDLQAIRRIYNEAVEDRSATLETERKSPNDMEAWWNQHDKRYAAIVATRDGEIIGFASLNRFSHRCAHSEIADLSVYVARKHRGTGVGLALLERLTQEAKDRGFHKIVLHALDENEYGKRLYRKTGFVEVGVFKEHGRLDGRYVDVIAMERLL